MHRTICKILDGKVVSDTAAEYGDDVYVVSDDVAEDGDFDSGVMMLIVMMIISYTWNELVVGIKPINPYEDSEPSQGLKSEDHFVISII